MSEMTVLSILVFVMTAGVALYWIHTIGRYL